jgi:uncharacterized protein YjdB
MNIKYLYYTIATIFLFSCSKDDDNSIAVSNILIEPIMLTLIAGDMETLTAIVQPGNATNQAITWASNNKEVVAVDKSGNVNAKTPGNAIITATAQDNGITAISTITVFPADKVLFKKNRRTILVGNVIPIPIFMKQDDLENTTFEWHCDNNAVAMVDERGYVRGLSEGIATITCTAYCGKVQDSFTISVLDYDNSLILYEVYTGVLSYENGEMINFTSTMDMWLMCTSGIDFSYCFWGLSMNITYEEKNISLSLLDMSLITENNHYSIYGETTFDGYPITVNGMLKTEDDSANLNIYLAKESPVNLIFQGSIKY